MEAELAAVSVQYLSFREYFSSPYMKSTVRGFIYEYETAKIVTIHSISSNRTRLDLHPRLLLFLFFSLVALMCRIIQVLILIYGIAYLMIHKKGYQETDTSIISSITLKVKVGRSRDLPFVQMIKWDLLHLPRALDTIRQKTIKLSLSMVQVKEGERAMSPFLFHAFLEDYIVPPQENNALFLMTNFIRTDQEHKRCAGRSTMLIVTINTRSIPL